MARRAVSGGVWRAVAVPHRATTAGRACGCTPSPRGAGSRGSADTHSEDASWPAAAAARAATPRRAAAFAGTAATNGAGWRRHRLATRTPGNDLAAPWWLCVAAPGSEVSPSYLPQHVDIQRLVTHDPLQPRILLLQLLEPHDILRAHRLVLRPPSLVGLDRQLQMPAHVDHLGALCEQLVCLSQLPYHLLR